MAMSEYIKKRAAQAGQLNNEAAAQAPMTVTSRSARRNEPSSASVTRSTEKPVSSFLKTTFLTVPSTASISSTQLVYHIKQGERIRGRLVNSCLN